MARKDNSQPLSEVIKLYINAMKLTPGLREVRVIAAWEKTLGPSISKHTTTIKLRKSVLIVQLDSSVIRQELHYSRTKVIELLNEELKEDIIKELKLK